MRGKIDEQALFFSNRLRQRLTTNLRRVVLFGSRARGEAREGSDYDFAVVLDKKDAPTVAAVREVEVEFLDKFDTLSSSIICDEQEWESNKRMPIGRNIEKDGIPL